MKQHSKWMTALVAALLVSAAQGGAQTTTAAKKPVHHHRHRTTRRPVHHEEGATEHQIDDLREQISGQQVEIDNLKSQLSTSHQQAKEAEQARQASAATAQAQVAQAAQQSAQAQQQSIQNTQDVQQLKTSVSDLSTQNTSLQQTVAADRQQVQKEIDSPTALHYKGVTIQPIGFFAFEGVWRQHSVNSDINTPFNTIPLPSANEGHVSELNFSARQSRLALLVTGNPGTYKLTGYFEGDFLGSGTTSNNNQSNSYVFRQRQFWGQARRNGFAVTGGQMWSLVTEDKLGTDNRTEVTPNTIDPQYLVGFNWARQPGLRLQQSFGTPKTGMFTGALSVEQAQITNFTASSTVSAAVPANFFFAGAGQNGGLYNAYNGTYANNVAPDVLVKGALDAPHFHLEAGGIARFLRDYYYPITGTSTTTAGVSSYTTSQPYQSNTAAAGGAFGAVRVYLAHFLELGMQAMGGTGVGRYGSSQLSDATIKPNGTLEPIRNYRGLASVVTHEGRKLDIFFHYGGEYDQRTVYTVTTGAFAGDQIGYGPRNLNDAGCYALPANPGSSTGGSPSAPSTCASPTRYIQEGMFGFIFRAIDSPAYGRLQYSATYQYIQRNLWSGSVASASAAAFEPLPTPTGPRAQDSMIHVSMRYYIP